jgi:hypothetical protein
MDEPAPPPAPLPPPPPAPPPALSSDGTLITNGTGSVRTAYGTFTFGDLFASVPHYGGGQFYTPLLNGKPCNPSYPWAWAQSFEVDFVLAVYGGSILARLGKQFASG